MSKRKNDKQEPSKASLPVFIESLYYKRFGLDRPEQIVTIEQRARQIAEKRAARGTAKAARHAEAGDAAPTS